MTQELSPEARALLDAAREGLGPDPAAVRRMREKIELSVATGGAATASALAAKLGIGFVVAAIAVGAVVYRESGSAPVHEPARVVAAEPAAPVVPAEPRVEPSAGARAVEPPSAAPDADEDEVEIEMAPVVVPERREPARSGRKPPEVAPRRAAPAETGAGQPASDAPPMIALTLPAPRRADLAREVALVDRAMSSLRGGDPAGALDAVRLHARETAGDGQLAEDAAAIEIEALCRLHDASARDKLAAFDARWPASAQRTRITRRCP
ncbi:MAG: hypothetical protein ACTHU0_04545 [Kofleriaceae bacterium]